MSCCGTSVLVSACSGLHAVLVCKNEAHMMMVKEGIAQRLVELFDDMGSDWYVTNDELGLEEAKKAEEDAKKAKKELKMAKKSKKKTKNHGKEDTQPKA